MTRRRSVSVISSRATHAVRRAPVAPVAQRTPRISEQSRFVHLAFQTSTLKNAHVSGTNKTAASIAGFFSGAQLLRDEGQTLAEYALILTLIAVAVVMAVFLFGGKIGNMWSSINDTFQKF